MLCYMFPPSRGTVELSEPVVRKRKASMRKAGAKGSKRPARKAVVKKGARRGRSRSRRRSRKGKTSKTRRYNLLHVSIMLDIVDIEYLKMFHSARAGFTVYF